MIIISAGFMILLLATVTPAFAYMDPNTGNLIYQILFPIITVLATVYLFFKSKVRRLFQYLKMHLASFLKRFMADHRGN